MSFATEDTSTAKKDATSVSCFSTALVPALTPSTSLVVLEDRPRFLYEYIEGHDLVDALPYLDAFTDDAKEEAKKLVMAEMTEFSPRDYLADLSTPRTPLIDAVFNVVKDSKLGADSEISSPEGATEDLMYGWQMDLYRRRVGEKPFQKLNMSRYTLPTPTGTEQKDLGAWKRSLDNAKAQVGNVLGSGSSVRRVLGLLGTGGAASALSWSTMRTQPTDLTLTCKRTARGYKDEYRKAVEQETQRFFSFLLFDIQEHSALRLLNLELASKHAKAYWQRHVEETQYMEARYKRHLTCLTEKLESINKKRKLEQVSGGNALRLLMRSYEDVFERNLNILPAIRQVKEEVDQLAAALEGIEQQ